MAEKVSGNRIRVFVYGTLKEGHGNHDYFFAGNPEIEKLGRCYITGDFAMYSNGAFPILTQGDDPDARECIVGEVYEVDEVTLDGLDALEGHPDWYRRVKVETPFKKAWVYVMPKNDGYPAAARVTSGCWAMSREEEEWINGSEVASTL